MDPNDKTDKVVPLPFPEVQEEDDSSSEEWYQSLPRTKTRRRASEGHDYATSKVFRRFALWLFGKR